MLKQMTLFTLPLSQTRANFPWTLIRVLTIQRRLRTNTIYVATVVSLDGRRPIVVKPTDQALRIGFSNITTMTHLFDFVMFANTDANFTWGPSLRSNGTEPNMQVGVLHANYMTSVAGGCISFITMNEGTGARRSRCTLRPHIAWATSSVHATVPEADGKSTIPIARHRIRRRWHKVIIA